MKTYTRKQLKNIKILDFKEGDTIKIVDTKGEVIYTIDVSYGNYKLPLKTVVLDKNMNILGCTAGTKGGWPYYIAEFIHNVD